MPDFINQLLENNVISEEIKSEIENAWEQRIQENRQQVAQELRESIAAELRETVNAQLREEFAQKYEHDKSIMVEAVETMLAERLQAELAELAEDRQGLIEARAQYAAKMTQDAELLESFVLNNLSKEVAELAEDRKTAQAQYARLEQFVVEALSKEIAELIEDRQKVAANIGVLESFVHQGLAKEITEFYADKKDLAETKVRLIKESREKFESVKKNFIKRSASLVEETVGHVLRREMTQLKEDIEHARKNDFGRRIFESFASEYAASHLNERRETARLMRELQKKDQALEEAAAKIVKHQKLVESKEAELRVARDIAKRKDIMNELLGPLSGDKKQIMRDLLESVQTERLHSAFDKYLPAVMENSVPRRSSALMESKQESTKAITGDKTERNICSEEKTAEIYDIRRLAGLK